VTRLYLLAEDGKTPVPVEMTDEGMQKYGEWYEDFSHRIVANTAVGELRVSTVFLGIDHGFGIGKPVLWETMIFPKDSLRELYQDRYTSHDDAVKGHEAAIAYAEALEAAEREMPTRDIVI